MVISTLRFVPSPKQHSEVLEILRSVVGPTEIQPGCLSCRIYEEDGPDHATVLCGHWETEAALHEHILFGFLSPSSWLPVSSQTSLRSSAFTTSPGPRASIWFTNCAGAAQSSLPAHKESKPMQLKQVSDNCFAVLNEKNRVCDANSGLINRAGGVVIDTQSDLAHARQMIELFGKVWTAMPKRVDQHARGRGPRLGQSALRRRRDHCPPVGARADEARRRSGGNPETAARCQPDLPSRLALKALHPGVAAAGRATGWRTITSTASNSILPTTLFDTRYELDLDGTEVHLIYVGPCHQVGDTIIHVPQGARGVRRRRGLPAVHADGLDGVLREVVPVPRPDHSTQRRKPSSPATARSAASKGSRS